MKTFQLSCFLTVAETLNFARAAERLNVTQPAVTHQIRSLETELNTTLFLRTTHSVELTHAGHLLVEDARTIVTTSVRAQRRFETMQEGDIPVFALGCHIDGYLQCLPEILREFSGLYPEIHPQVYMKPSLPLLFRLLDDEKADIIFGIKDTSARHPGIYRELMRSPIVCVCAAEHPLASRSSIKKEELQSERLILFDTTKSSFFTAGLQGEMIAGRRPEELYFCESTMTAILLAKAQYGLFFLPDVLVPDDEDLAVVPMEDAGAESFGFYYRTLQNNQPLKDFISLVKKQFPS